MASLAASDAAMISASQVLNATETCLFWNPMIRRLGQAGTRSPTESVSQPSPHRRSPQVGVRMVCSANRHVCGVRDMLVGTLRAAAMSSFVGLDIALHSMEVAYATSGLVEVAA